MASAAHFGLTTADGRRPRVAIVCGNPASAMVTIMLCEQFGCAPYAAASGEAVLALLRRDDVDLVMLDLSMTDMDAIAVAQLIRTLGTRGAMPIVALAEKASDLSEARARVGGFAETVVKPYSPRELYGAMQSALERPSAAVGIR
jgi:two-component system response regulator BaeR